jgi:uncharacterized RDD family membrane protein YckC
MAWLIHIAIVVIAISWYLPIDVQACCEAGNQAALLASGEHRSIAFFIDLLFPFAILFAFHIFGAIQIPTFEERHSETLFSIEKFPLKGPFDATVMFGRQFFDESPGLTLFVATLFGLVFARAYSESKYGLTPGKWLTGIRTVRTTLRPCGFAASLVRTILYWIDCGCMLTPLPVAICMMVTPQRQRLGDLVADSVVIKRQAS